MEIKISTKTILQILYVLSWIIFLGLCVEAGGIICNSFFALVINPVNASSFWEGADLTALLEYDSGHFLVETLLMSIPAVMKALMFYLIVRILHEKKLDMVQPFNEDLRSLMLTVAFLALGIGLFSKWGIGYALWLVEQGVAMPDVQHLYFDGADVWLFMAIILFVIAQIFKRGIEIQSEHELTV